MSKTRRQRAIEHPDKPKRGVRDPRRAKFKLTKDGKIKAAVELGRLGGKAPHKTRGRGTGLEKMDPDKLRETVMKGVEARRLKRDTLIGEMVEL